MKIEPFALERWMTIWETRVEFDIAESGILPLTVNDLLALLPPGEREVVLAGLLDTRPRGPAEPMGARGVTERLLGQVREHRLEHLRAYRSSGGVVEVDGAGGHAGKIGAPYMLCTPMRTTSSTATVSSV